MNSVRVPKVSVCIPTFNRAHFLADAIASALAQTYSDFELVVSDNASTDNTAEVLARFRDPRMRVQRNATNIGLLGNFIRCFELARGAYAVILGSDDYWEPTLLAKLVPVLDENPRVLLAQSGGINVSPERQLLRTHILPLERVTPGLEYFRRIMMDELPDGFLSSTLFRMTAVRLAGGFDARLPNTQDFALVARLALEGDFGFVAEPLVYARKHPGNYHQNWDEAEYLKERLRLAREIFDEWPQVQQPALANLRTAAKDKLALAVLENLVAARLAGASRRDVAELFWSANGMRASRLPQRCLLKAASAFVFSRAFLPRVVARFGSARRQLSAGESRAH
jgi:glycosyltransferase involved in cell wall biosynthesis